MFRLGPALFFISEIFEHPFLRPRKTAASRIKKQNRLIDCSTLTNGTRAPNYSIFTPVQSSARFGKKKRK